MDIYSLMRISSKNYLVVRNPKDAVFVDETIFIVNEENKKIVRKLEKKCDSFFKRIKCQNLTVSKFECYLRHFYDISVIADVI